MSIEHQLIEALPFIAAGLSSLLVIALMVQKTFFSKVLSLYLTLFGIVIFSYDTMLVAAVAMLAPCYYIYVGSFLNIRIRKSDAVHILNAATIALMSSILTQQAIWIIIGFQMVAYGYISRKRLLFWAKAKGISLFTRPGSRYAWFRNFAILQIVLITAMLWGLINPTIDASPLISVLLIINCLFIYYQVFSESNFFAPPPPGQKYAKSSLSAEQKYAILNRLEKFMLTEKYYVSANATLTDLADRINTSTHNLSQVLNEQKNQTFAEYLMQYRVLEAKKLLRLDGNKLKIEDIAESVGYNSKSAFNTAFKRVSGITPSEFRQLKNVRDYREVRLAGRSIHDYGHETSSLNRFQNNIDMVQNSLKIFLRNLKRNKVFTAINLVGLVVGFTSSVLIYLFISDELSYDKHFDDSNNIYRIVWLNESPQTRTPHPMAQALVRDFPEVEDAVTISPWYGAGLSKQEITVRNLEDNIQFEEPDFYFVDSTFFDVFSFKLKSGNLENALKHPNGIILSEEMATKFFGSGDPLGRILEINSRDQKVEVVGVVENTPRNTHFHFNFLISYVTLKSWLPEDSFWITWGDFGHFNYVRLQEGADAKKLESKIPEWFLTYNDWPESAQAGLLDGSDKFALQPISNIHLHSKIRWELETNGNILYIYILTGAVLFILTIACINYVNLTTAKSVERAKEIGVRKTLGAVRSQLSVQFLIESVIFCSVAWVLAIVLSSLLINNFNELSSKTFSFQEVLSPQILLTGFIGTILVGLFAGLYPSLILSSYKPTDVLKGNFSRSAKGNILGRILVVAQFVISAILITASLVILQQTQYLKNKPLGFDKDHLITIPIKTHDLRIKHETIVNELENLGEVISATAVSNIPGGQFNQNAIWIDEDIENPVTVSEMTFDYNTIETLGLKLVEGRGFDPSHALDSAGGSFIVNEITVRRLGLENSLGHKVFWDLEEGVREGRIVGVVEDFHYKSLHQSIQPLIIDMRRSLPGHLLVKIRNQDIQSSVEAIETTYQSFNTTHDFEFNFLDQSIDELYTAEVRTLNIFGIFSGIALFLACLGLFGIAISMMNQKLKEVGMRKILGATTAQIVLMINSWFSRLVLIAVLIGLPIAYLLMQEWMAEFPYRTTIGAGPFLIAVAVLLIVATVSVASVIVKLSLTNPADVIRQE
ncbi:MAG: ABC transporter permease [Cyclobacteriaceae bacterium]